MLPDPTIATVALCGMMCSSLFETSGGRTPRPVEVGDELVTGRGVDRPVHDPGNTMSRP